MQPIRGWNWIGLALIAAENVAVKPGSRHIAAVQAEDPDRDALAFEWQVVAEVTRAGYAGRGEQRSKPMPELIGEAKEGQVAFTAPEQDGAYRVFVFVRDGEGNGATANIPFQVQR